MKKQQSRLLAYTLEAKLFSFNSKQNLRNSIKSTIKKLVKKACDQNKDK
jgi:hypothetical protein